MFWLSLCRRTAKVGLNGPSDQTPYWGTCTYVPIEENVSDQVLISWPEKVCTWLMWCFFLVFFLQVNHLLESLLTVSMSVFKKKEAAALNCINASLHSQQANTRVSSESTVSGLCLTFTLRPYWNLLGLCWNLMHSQWGQRSWEPRVNIVWVDLDKSSDENDVVIVKISGLKTPCCFAPPYFVTRFWRPLAFMWPLCRFFFFAVFYPTHALCLHVSIYFIDRDINTHPSPTCLSRCQPLRSAWFITPPPSARLSPDLGFVTPVALIKAMTVCVYMLTSVSDQVEESKKWSFRCFSQLCSEVETASRHFWTGLKRRMDAAAS